LRKLVHAITEGVAARTLKDELSRLEARQDEIDALLSGSHDDRLLLVRPRLADVYRRKVTDLHNALLQQETRVAATEILLDLLDEIKLTPEDGALRIDLKGAFAGMLRLAASRKSPSQIATGLSKLTWLRGPATNFLERRCGPDGLVVKERNQGYLQPLRSRIPLLASSFASISVAEAMLLSSHKRT